MCIVGSSVDIIFKNVCWKIVTDKKMFTRKYYFEFDNFLVYMSE